MRGVSADVREAMTEMFAAGTEWAEQQKTTATDPEPWAEKLQRERNSR